MCSFSLQRRPRTCHIHALCAFVMGRGSLRNKGRPDGLHVISCWGKEQYQSQFMLTRIVCILLVLFSASGLSGTDFSMKVTDKNYLDTQGFSVFLYDSTYHPVFVDQKNTAMEMILHGQRIATNGDVRLMPTPEQWDLVATLKGRHADKANDRLIADLSFPTFDFSYTLEVAAEPGGVKVSINLDKPLPQKLEGRAGFNLEFLPSIYMGKAYMVDGTKAGIFPRTPNDAMTKVLPLEDEPKKAYYLEDWDKAKGYTQPLPFAEGKSITLGVDDALARVNVVSDTANLMLFDGRDRAQNGWFVLRSLIPSGKTTGAIVWHIRPDVIPNWTRPPMIAHSQVGYAPGFSKVAVLELDPKYNGPKTARVLRLTESGAYEQVFEGAITPATPWLRYVYSKFDFTLREGARFVRNRVCRPAHGSFPDFPGRLCKDLAGQPGPSPCGADGSRCGSRRIPGVAWRFAP